MAERVVPPLPIIPTGERCILFGNTRQGKSQLAKALLRAKRHVIAVDTKRREDFSDVAHSGKPIDGDVKKIKEVYRGGRVWWRPSFVDDDYDKIARPQWEEFFVWALRLGNLVIYIDEIVDVAVSAVKYPHAMRRAVKTGGAAGVGVWGTTQEPRGIPLWTAGQADYLFTFHVGLPEYRQRIDEIFEERVPWHELKAYSYRFVWKDRHGMHGPTKLNMAHPNAPKPTKVTSAA